MGRMNNEHIIYNAALYCRLSKDDEQAGESVSIGTQKMILEKVCKEQDFRVFDVYVDDGFSGLNFERPEFQRMLKDIEDGKINLVITKDLSRLGRDYIQTGYYTEVYFAQKRVRYIAVNDGIDTNRDDNDIAPFKNILNDMYAKDLSRKVKGAKRQRAYKGFFISAQTPYGYKIDPMDKKHLVVDEEVSDVVKEIFRLALSGKSLVQISRILTENQILTPGSYKAMKGDTRFERYLKDGKYSFNWCYQKNPLYKSVMNIIVRANKEKFEEVREGMCEALEELFADKIEEMSEEKSEEKSEKKVKRVNDLIAKLLEQNRLDDIAKSVKDQAYQNKLIEEFGL